MLPDFPSASIPNPSPASTPMKRLGIYYHPSFSRKSYMTIGNRLRDFPEALEAISRDVPRK